MQRPTQIIYIYIYIYTRTVRRFVLHMQMGCGGGGE